jgi:hypothetical protein
MKRLMIGGSFGFLLLAGIGYGWSQMYARGYS